MTLLSYKLVSDINDEVNASVTYQTDVQQYSNPEFWEPAGNLGDCEDYALLKRNKLLEAGADESQLGLVLCFVRNSLKKKADTAYSGSTPTKADLFLITGMKDYNVRRI
jgi:predicted transglutaminase-like cysteine proteinase